MRASSLLDCPHDGPFDLWRFIGAVTFEGRRRGGARSAGQGAGRRLADEARWVIEERNERAFDRGGVQSGRRMVGHGEGRACAFAPVRVLESSEDLRLGGAV